MKILFRHHRGSLQDSIATLKEFNSLKDLTEYLEKYCKENYFKANNQFYIDLYNDPSFPFDLGKDERIGWKNTFVVGIKKNGIIGWMCIQ